MEKKSILDPMPFTVDSFFTTQEQRDEEKKEKVEEISIDLLDEFPNHPFKALKNEELSKLEESIKDNGVLEPIIVRKKDDRYEIKRYKRMITEENEKQERLLDMYLDGTVDLPTFEEFHKKYGSKIETYKVEIDELEKSLKRLEPIQVKKEKAMESVKKILDIGYNGIDERLIEEVVEKIIVHENYFEWKLNFYDQTFKLKIIGKGEKNSFIEEYKE